MAKRLYTVGNNSTVFRSDDNGISWQSKSAGITGGRPFYHVSAFDDFVVVGGQGLTVWASVNGGDNWNSFAIPFAGWVGSARVYGIKCIGTLDAILAVSGTGIGSTTSFFKTIDGGVSWVIIGGNINTRIINFDLSLTDINKLVYADHISGVIYYSANQGISWLVSNIIGGGLINIVKVRFASDGPVCIVMDGQGKWTRSGNSGATFNTQSGVLLGSPATSGSVFINSFTSLLIIAKQAYAVILQKLYTTNRDIGTTSFIERVPNSSFPATEQINDVVFIDVNVGFFFGNAGQFLKTSNAMFGPSGSAAIQPQFTTENINEATFTELPGACDIEITVVNTTNSSGGANGTATIIATGLGAKEYSLDAITWQLLNAFTGLTPGIKTAYARIIANPTCMYSIPFTISDTPTLQGNTTKTNVTVNAGSDGTVTVNITGGSGQYEIEWLFDNLIVSLVNNNPIQSTTRPGLAASTYQILVTDLITGQTLTLEAIVSEPQLPPPPDGSYLFVPAMNSITFVNKQVVDGCTVFQTLDNTLFCEQHFDGFKKVNYYQRVAKCDTPVIQFQSDFGGHDIEMRDYISNALIANFNAELKEANINQPREEGIFITNHIPGQSRIYFNVGGIPLPVSIGDPFEIFNNADGFNGMYSILSIQNDVLLGTQYLVVTKPYLISNPSSAGNARFLVTLVPFNVYEFVITNLGLYPNGKYFFKIKGTGSINQIEWTSEPINLQPSFENDNVIEVRNIDNAFDMTYTTGITNKIRVESTFFKRMPTGEDTNYRNSDQSLVKLSAKRRRGIMLELWHLSPYMHEKLSVYFGHDVIKINGVRMQADEKYDDPKYITRYPLSNSSIVLEQYGWFDKYNGHDIGSVDGEGGFIIANGGFIKR